MAIERNGVRVSVQTLPDRKLPHLCVMFPDHGKIYPVATFRDEQTAQWFKEVMMEKFFKGSVKDEAD